MNLNIEQEIPIFFSADDRYLPFLAVSLRSLIDNASRDKQYAVYVLNNGLQPERQRRIENMACDYVHIRFVNVKKLLAPIQEKLHLRDYYSTAIYYRLFIPSMFPQYDKALYLDCDITVPGDISRLYATPLGNHLVGAVMDDVVAENATLRRYATNAWGIPDGQYFNSGVMLMNLRRFREEKIQERFAYLLINYGFDTIAPDQDYLNALCRDQVVYLDESWNKMESSLPYDGPLYLIHYNMFRKPWLYDGVLYGNYFWEYARQTDFYEEICALGEHYGWRDRMHDQLALLRMIRRSHQISEAENTYRNVMNDQPSMWQRQEA